MSTELVCPFKNEIIYSDTPSTEQELWYNQNVYGVIYKITNILNNKSYIGRRKCVKNKLSSLHRYWGSGSYIRNAIKKYGLENFTKEYIDFAMSDEELDILEMKYIEKFNTYKDGYNQTIGGEHFRGEIHNIDSLREKQSSSLKKFWSNKKNHDRMIQKRAGRKNSNATKKLMSKSAKKSWTEERHRKAIESGNYAKHYTKEQIEHNRQVHIGLIHVNNGEITIAIKENELDTYLKDGWKRGNHKEVSLETRHKQSIAAKKRKSNTKGKIAIHKENIKKYVDEKDLTSYTENGWERGLPEIDIIKSKNHKSIKGRKSIIKDGIIKLIEQQNLEEFLNNGWVLNMVDWSETFVESTSDLANLKSEHPFFYKCCKCGNEVHIKSFNKSRIKSYSKLLCRSCIQRYH